MLTSLRRVSFHGLIRFIITLSISNVKSLKFRLLLSSMSLITNVNIGCPNAGPSAEVLFPWGSQESCCCRYFIVTLWFIHAHRLSFYNFWTYAAMPELLRSAKLAVEKGQAQGRDESYVKQLSDYIIPALVEALHKVYLKISQQSSYYYFTHADIWTFCILCAGARNRNVFIHAWFFKWVYAGLYLWPSAG